MSKISEAKFKEFEDRVNKFPRFDAYVEKKVGEGEEKTVMDVNEMFQAYTLDVVKNLQEIFKEPDGPEFVHVYIGLQACELAPELMHMVIASYMQLARLVPEMAETAGADAVKAMFTMQVVTELFKHKCDYEAMFECMVDKFSKPIPKMSQEVH